MREGWVEKRFDEVFSLQMGKTPDRKNFSLFEGDNIWVSIKDLEDKYISSSKECISDEAASNINIVKSGTVIMSFKLTIGKCAIAATDLYTNEAIMAFNTNDGYEIDSSFLYYYLQGYEWEGLNNAVMGLTLNKSTISKHKISFPTILIQQAIASELDMITEMISKYDEQLKELDKLSQSIFYEMFGDPVENEKGWEVKIISDVSTYFNGVAHEQDIDDDGEFTLINSKFISTNGKVQKRTNKQRFPLLKNDLTMVLSDVPNGKALAKCYLVNEDNKYSLNQRICCFRGYEGAPLFFKYVVNRHQYFLSFNDGKGQTNLRKGDVEKMPIILPPLPLQQSFARKIEAIEAMKSKVKEAKKEAETLLAARMQYWFE